MSASTSWKPSISIETLSPTTRNLLNVLDRDPVIFLKRDDPGRKNAPEVYEELRSLSGNGFQVFENAAGMGIVRDGAARRFIL